MELTDEFTRERRESHRWKFAAECQGVNDDVWVLNETVQVDQYGNLLAEWSTKFVWLGRLVSREGVVPHKLAAEIATPLGATCLVNILDSLRMSSGKLTFYALDFKGWTIRKVCFLFMVRRLICV